MPRRRSIVAGALVVGLVGAAGWRGHREAGPVLRTQVVGQGISTLMVDRRVGRAVLTAWSPANIAGRVLLLDTATGTLLHTASLPGIPPTQLLGDGAGLRFVAQSSWFSGRVSVLAGRDGATVRTLPNAVPVESGAPELQGSRVYLTNVQPVGCSTPPDCASSVRVLEVRSGRPLLTFVIPGQVSAIALDMRPGHLLVVTTSDAAIDRVSLLDAANGRVLHTVTLSGWPVGLLLDASSGRLFVATGSRTSLAGTVYVLDTRTGTLVRSIQLGVEPAAMAVDEQRGHVYLAVGPIGMYIIKAPKGAIGPQSGPGGPAMGYSQSVPAGNGSLITLDARTGMPLRRTPLGFGPGGVAVDQRTGNVFVTTTGPAIGVAVTSAGIWSPATQIEGPGRLTVLDGDSGVIRRTITVGDAPGLVAVDPQRQRVLVVNAGSVTRAGDPWAWVPGWLRARLPLAKPVDPSPQMEPATVMLIDESRL